MNALQRSVECGITGLIIDVHESECSLENLDHNEQLNHLRALEMIVTKVR